MGVLLNAASRQIRTKPRFGSISNEINALKGNARRARHFSFPKLSSKLYKCRKARILMSEPGANSG
jgi:hypothetical protein